MLVSEISVGDILAFQIIPDPDNGQINAGRWGVIKVLNVDANECATVQVYANLYDTLPKLGWFARPTPLIERRFPHLERSRRQAPSTPTLLEAESVKLPNVQRIKAKSKLTKFEATVKANIESGVHLGSYMAWSTIVMIIDEEDRAQRDRSSWEADVARRTAENEARFRANQERMDARLKGITLAQLASEKPFIAWDERTKIIPPAYRERARDRIRTLIATLEALGEKPRRPAVRKELRACVEWFNEVDGTMGYAIETEEREDIYAALEEICWACKQKPLVHEIENWRDW